MIIESCDKCDLCLTNLFRPVKPHMASFKTIFMITDFPYNSDRTKNELMKGNNPSNRMLLKAINDHSLNNHVYITSSIKCKPRDSFLQIAAEKCRPYLLDEIVLYKPKVIILFGDNSIKQFIKVAPYKLYFTSKNIGNTTFIFLPSLNKIRLKTEYRKKFTITLTFVESILKKYYPYYK